MYQGIHITHLNESWTLLINFIWDQQNVKNYDPKLEGLVRIKYGLLDSPNENLTIRSIPN